MKRLNSKQSTTNRRWIQPLLGSITLIDITLGSLFAGAALAQGPESDYLAKLSFGLLAMGCLSLWCLALVKPSETPLTDHNGYKSRGA